MNRWGPGKTMARVLIVAYTTYFNDGRVKRHAEALAERGDHTDVICLASPLWSEAHGVNVIGLKLRRYRGASRAGYLRSYLRFFMQASLKALQLSRAARYDLVIVCTMPDAAVLCAIGPRLLGSKVLLDIHDTMPELYRDKFGGRRGAVGARLLMAEERASAALADRVLAVHERHRERLLQAGIPGRKIAVVMNLPDARIFSPRASHSHASGRFTAVCHGTLTRRLGLDTALIACSLLRRRIPGFQLRVIGGGDYLEEARQLARNLDLGCRVEFLASVAIGQLPWLLQDADVGIVPNHASSATHLMLPVKLLEYATLEIPIVAARLQTIEHYFDPQSVQFFDPGNPATLADAIEELYCEPGRRVLMAQRAREVAEELSWERQRQEFYAVVDSLLK
jgi:glycosyltransferase involved in cell wall biosynthesis